MLLTIIRGIGSNHYASVETHQIPNDAPIPRVGELFDGIEVVEVSHSYCKGLFRSSPLVMVRLRPQTAYEAWGVRTQTRGCPRTGLLP